MGEVKILIQTEKGGLRVQVEGQMDDIAVCLLTVMEHNSDLRDCIEAALFVRNHKNEIK